MPERAAPPVPTPSAALAPVVPPFLRVVVGRLAAGVVTLWLISMLIFTGTQVLPGDVAQAILGRDAQPAALADVRHRLGLDHSAVHRYIEWIWGVLHGNLGESAVGVLSGQSGSSVWSLISDRLVNSAILALLALVGIVILGVAAGIASALASDRVLDRVISIISVSFVALPEFVIGTLLTLVVASWLGLVPPVSLITPGQSPLDHPDLLVLPVLTLLAASAAQVVRMVRAGMLDSLRQPYVEAARLAGIHERRVIVRYALRNAMGPTVQVVAQTAQWLVGGIIITEAVFDYPGIGQALVQAVSLRDVPYVQSVTLILAAVYICLNILADLAVAYLVPRRRTDDLGLM